MRNFDTAGGFTAVYGPTINHCLQRNANPEKRIDQADSDLREARDLYAYLLTFAPDRFRKDVYYTGTPPPGYTEPLCARGKARRSRTRPIRHTPASCWTRSSTGATSARLRQAVRESVNIRMIFGQQFMVDALGLHFSGK